MSYWVLALGAILFLFSIGVLVWSVYGTRNPYGITQRRLQGILHDEQDAGMDKEQDGMFIRLLKRLGATQMVTATERMQTWRRELRVLLTQAGIHNREIRILIKGGIALVPYAAALIAFVVVVGSDALTARGLTAVFLSFGAGLLLPRYLLRYRAAHRREQIIEEVPIMVRLVSLLFEAGLSLESALKILCEEARGILPNLSVEIERMMLRVTSGMDRVEALEQMARDLDIQELTDAVSVLGHTTKTGGSVRQSLARLADVIDDHSRTRLRERVGRLSAKMTIVMVVFLFPALFIFLAGPGLIAVAGALGGLK